MRNWYNAMFLYVFVIALQTCGLRNDVRALNNCTEISNGN